MAEPSWQDMYDQGKATMQARRPKLVINPGDASDAILAGAATIGTAIIAYATSRFLACFLDSASGADLTTLAHDRGVDRIIGTSSVGSVTLSRPTDAFGAFTYPAGSRIATLPDLTGQFQIFTLKDDAVFAATDLTISAIANCSKSGVAGKVAASTITRFIDQPLDTTLTVTNQSLFAGGAEEEADEDLRDRVRGFFLTQARGTIDALIYGAKQVDGVARVSVSVDDAGVVSVYVADADGDANQTMADNVATELESWRDAADIVDVYAGVIVDQAIDLSVTVRTGTDLSALLDTIRAAVVSSVGRLNPGETLYRDAISTAAKDVDRQNIVSVRVNNPPADIAPTASQLMRTSTNIITFS